jgi:predicted O-methyltransferase YrrM
VLTELRAATKKAMPAASHMTSGPLQGRLLKSLVAIKGAKRVLEIGTFTGYSAQCMAEALATSGGSLVTLEIDPEAAAIAMASGRDFARRESLLA